jgi:hypothetical protein
VLAAILSREMRRRLVALRRAAETTNILRAYHAEPASDAPAVGATIADVP